MDNDKMIKYTTVDEQLQLLINKGLLIENIPNAKKAIEAYGYYNIINSYKAPYLLLDGENKRYITGTTFEQIYSMSNLDHNLRNSIMAAMLDFEEHLRAATAEVIASSFGTDHNNYLSWNNYRDRRVSNPKFCLRSILSILHQNAASDKNPIKYYRKQYGVVPPWILFKGTYFSTLINFIRLLKDTQKSELIHLMYHIPISECSLPSIKKLFSDTLFMCLDYRNRAAHGGRIYNFEPKNYESIITNSDLQADFGECFKKLKRYFGISRFIVALFFFSYKTPAKIINITLKDEINRHLNMYPVDISILESLIGTGIIQNTVVWITENSNIFHSNPTCSGLLNPTQINLDSLDTNMYTPCKRCCK